MKNPVHTKLFNVIAKEIGEKYINRKKRTINTGLYQIRIIFFKPKHHLAMHLLVLLFKYRIQEERFWFKKNDETIFL